MGMHGAIFSIAKSVLLHIYVRGVINFSVKLTMCRDGPVQSKETRQG